MRRVRWPMTCAEATSISLVRRATSVQTAKGRAASGARLRVIMKAPRRGGARWGRAGPRRARSGVAMFAARAPGAGGRAVLAARLQEFLHTIGLGADRLDRLLEPLGADPEAL